MLPSPSRERTCFPRRRPRPRAGQCPAPEAESHASQCDPIPGSAREILLESDHCYSTLSAKQFFTLPLEYWLVRAEILHVRKHTTQCCVSGSHSCLEEAEREGLLGLAKLVKHPFRVSSGSSRGERRSFSIMATMLDTSVVLRSWGSQAAEG
jgi:hypothetical protein